MNIIKRIKFWLQTVIFRRRAINYIHGAEGLPAPFDAERERAIMAELSDALETQNTAIIERIRAMLIEHNLRLVVYVAKKFENIGTNIEDLISIGTIGLIKAINTFRPDKNIKLATYASRCIENEILMYIRRGTGRGEVSFDEPLNVDHDGNELLLSDILGSEEEEIFTALSHEEETRVVRNALLALAPRDRKIIVLRFGMFGAKELTQKEVADKLGISQSYISRLEKKIMEDLRGELEGKV